MDLKFAELINIEELNDMAIRLYKIAGIPIGIIDVDGTVHVAAGWQRICTDYHRVNCKTRERCHISDSYINNHLHEEKYVEYKCLNNLWDIAMPIIVSKKHIATLFVGQFFYEGEEDIPEEQAIAEALPILIKRAAIQEILTGRKLDIDFTNITTWEQVMEIHNKFEEIKSTAKDGRETAVSYQDTYRY